MSRELKRVPYALRRIAIGFGGGFLLIIGPLLIAFLWTQFGVNWPKENSPTSLALVSLVVGSALLSTGLFLSAFSWMWYFRCPQCGQRINECTRVPLDSGPGKAMRYYCNACDVDWDCLWREGGGSGDTA